jgi:hypothetical protein
MRAERLFVIVFFSIQFFRSDSQYVFVADSFFVFVGGR